MKKWVDPAQGLANARHEFGEHGGVNMSIEASTTFTVMEPETMRRMFSGELGPERDFFIYSRHFNPTVLNLGKADGCFGGD
jgi:methionine-gamma-lyase